MACRGLASLLTSGRRGIALRHFSDRSGRFSGGGGGGGGGGADERRRASLHAQVLAGVQRSKTGAGKVAASGDRPLLLDTHALVLALERVGMSREQSGTIADALVSVSAAASQHARDQTVSKSAFSDLRAELSILEKADFAVLKGDIAALEKRLDTAVAQLYTEGERIENRIIKWVVALAIAVAFGLMRLTGGGSGTGNGMMTSVKSKSHEED